MRQVAADAFHNLAQLGYELERSLIQETWDPAREQADRLLLALSEASGSWSELFAGTDADKVQTAVSQLLALQSALHIGGPPVAEQLLEMRKQCATAYTLLGETAGKFKYLDIGNGPTTAWLSDFRGRFKTHGGGKISE